MKRRILLDTQALLWIRMDHPQLSKRAKSLYRSANNEVLLSIVTLWEITLKRSLGKLNLEGSLNQFFSSAFDILGLTLLPLTIDHVLKLEELPFHHRDPFDRMLIAQALHEKITVVGNDPCFDSYGVRR